MNLINSLNLKDKLTWNNGEWKNEQDYYYWIDETTLLNCLVARKVLGNLCGYVGLPEANKFYGLDYKQIESKLAHSIHGGLTYSDFGNELILHKSKEESNLWWVGFATSEPGDLIPNYNGFKYDNRIETYKDVKYVKKEVEKLALALV